MSIKEKLEPLSAYAVKTILITAIVTLTFWSVGKVSSNSDGLKIQKIEIENKSQTVRQLESKFDKVNTELLEGKNSSAQKQAELEAEKLRLEQELNKTKEQLQAKLDAKKQSSNTAYAGAQDITGSKLDWLKASTIPEQDWSMADWLITKESSWRPNAQNPKSTAYGLKQFLDATWAGVGCEKKQAINNPVYQLNCGQKYVMARYGSWAKAKTFWQANRWY